MAYEGQTYETILARMMARVASEHPNIDTREGSILFNALAPAAMELWFLYAELNYVLSESFVGTASRDYLFLACEQLGIDTSTFDASNGLFEGNFDVEVPIGSTWNGDVYNYTIAEYLGESGGLHRYSMTCNTAGSAPNSYRGELTPVSEVPMNLTYAVLINCLVEGEDEAEDDEIREAYFTRAKNSASDGNVATYQQWCDEYEGIGNVKIIPAWNGAGTVKVSILTTSNDVASDELVSEFQTYLDPGSNGMGDGVAPIGAKVTVSTATEKIINVAGTVKLKEGHLSTDAISTKLQQYFKDIAYEKSSVSYMSVGAQILDVEGVDTLNGLTLNGSTNDIILGNEEIPVLGAVNWTVSG